MDAAPRHPRLALAVFIFHPGCEWRDRMLGSTPPASSRCNNFPLVRISSPGEPEEILTKQGSGGVKTSIRTMPVRALCALCLLGLVTPPKAAEPTSAPTYRLDIPAQSLNDALQTFALASQHKLIYSSDLVDGKKSPALKGTYTTEQALKALLAGTNLTYELTSSGLVMIRAFDPAFARDAKHSDPPSGKEGKQASSGDSRVAQADQGQAQGTSTVEKPEEKEKEELKEANVHIPEILVKGTRILNVDIKRNVDDVQPYYIFDSQTMEESGVTNLEDFFKQRLTMDTRSFSNGQGGGSFQGNRSSIDLRGLGTNQTLILINGHRVVGAGFGFADVEQPDLNGIPIAAIERVEVLPSSAAAIYGGGAVGGVVNVILKKNYSGGEISARYDNTWDAAADQRALDASFGTSFEGGRTQLMVAGHYSDAGLLKEGDRLLRLRGITLINQNASGTLYSGFSPASIGATTNITSATNLILKNGTPLNSPFTFVPPGFSGSSDPAGFLANAGQQNFDPPSTAQAQGGLLSSLGSAPLVKSVLATLRREFTERLELYTELSYASNNARSYSNPLSIYTLRVPASAPTNPFQEAVFIRLPDATPVAADTTRDTVRRWSTGGILKLGHDWSTSIDYTWNSDDFSAANVLPDVGKVIAGLASGRINPFVDTLAYSQNLARYYGATLLDVTMTLNDVNLRIAGPVWVLPGGAVPLTVGVEHRLDALHDGSETEAFPGFPGDTVALLFPEKSQTIKSVYAELQVPVVSAANALPWVNQFDLQLSARREQYEVSTGTSFAFLPVTPGAITTSESRFSSTNPTFGFRYRPIGDVMLRASYGRGFLPPSLTQLAPEPPGQNTSSTTVLDPRRGNTPVTTLYQFGGNPDLQPEISKNLDAGIVFEPQGHPGLRMSLDWYRVDKTGNIVSLLPQAIVNAEASLPSRVTRGPPPGGNDPFPTVGPIALIDTTDLNLFRSQISGFDLSLSDRLQTEGFGTFDLFGLASRMVHFKTQTAVDAPLVETVGTGGVIFLNTPLKYKANAGVNWSLRGWTLGWSTRFYDSYIISINPVLIAQEGSSTVPSQIYHDFFVSYKPADGAPRSSNILSGLELRAGVKNVFNAVPPLDVNQSGFYDYTSFYGDFRLREYWLSVTKSF